MKKQKVKESEVLDNLNNMDEEDLKQFREKNKKHMDMISKRTVRNFFSGLFKRIVDLIAGLVGVIFLIPLIIIVFLIELFTGDFGPIFFIQERIGQKGKNFKMIKFRSMVVGADDILVKYLAENPEAAEEYKINKKLKNDPRVTKAGKFLRKTSLDEWPQFLHLLTGKMSLVGPRPYLPREREDMGEYYDFIIKMKPGITGPWQVAGRSELTFEDRLKLDEEYCARRGNRRDLKILFKTFLKVVRSEGAE
jgi:undecaprenyl-phosphate galactose phosphotransferase